MNDDAVLVVDGLAEVVRSPVPTFPRLVVADAAVDAPAGAWSGKRAFDVVLALVLLLVTLPLFLIVAVAIKLTSAGPVFFRQRRVGRGGEDFPMLKFRTMVVGSEERLRADPHLHELFIHGGHKIPSRIDPRVTRVGRLLRRLSLDELPQLLNVVSGHMSMVGPRPVERTQLDRDYGAYEPVYLALRPGLTGLWQVSGRSKVQFPARAQMDSHYLHHCHPWLDAKIILRTPLAVVSGLGAD